VWSKLGLVFPEALGRKSALATGIGSVNVVLSFLGGAIHSGN
jgi:hypothetical protein